MATSTIVITFNSDFTAGQYIQLRRRNPLDFTDFATLLETWGITRTANNVVKILAPTATAGENSAVAYLQAFKIDFNGTNLYNITRSLNVVTISFKDGLSINWEFYEFTTNGGATSTITNVAPSTFTVVEVPTTQTTTTVETVNDTVTTINTDPVTDITLEVVTDTVTSTTVNTTSPEVISTIFSTATKICSNVNVTIETSELATKIYINDILTNFTNTNNPVTFPVIRGLNNYIRLENGSGFIIEYPTIPKIYFDYLTSENINISVTQYLTGATLNVSVINKVGLTLQYSLDNVNWQTSSIFTGQEVGTRFLYVRDQFGCLKSKEYTVTELGTREAFFRISKANSINFSKVEVINGCTIFANDENSLACASLQQYKHITDTLFQTCDTTTIQFKSNYKTVSAVLRDSNGSETALTINKKSANLNRFQGLDAMYYKYREGKLAIYFDTGNSYDEFGTIIGTYTLGGNLPEFAIIGQYISIDTLGIFEIVDVLYDEVKNKRVIIINYTHNGGTISTIVESVYDVLKYEIYEFVIDWSLFSLGKYTVHITNTDATNGTRLDSSERVSLLTEQLNTLAISYSNNNNRDIFYKYGLVNFIRIPYVKFIAVQQDDNEINITDDNTVVVESSVYEKNEITFDVLTDQLMRKLVVALSCENLFINGIGYVKDGNVSSENIDNTNLYEVKATLIKTNVSYTNFKQGYTGIDAETQGTTSGRPSGRPSNNIPQIITTGTNFIKS